MPLYSYKCPEHGEITKIRRVADRETPIACPECGKECPFTPDFKTGAPVFKGSGFHATEYNVKEGSR